MNLKCLASFQMIGLVLISISLVEIVYFTEAVLQDLYLNAIVVENLLRFRETVLYNFS